jgi:drug/metabolite transporter (DMT)-like permease
MTAIALVLALLAAVMHATWNLFLKGSEDRLATVVLMGGIGTILYLPVAYVLEGPPAGVWDHVAASTVVHAVYFLALIAAYRRVDFSVAYPVARGIAPALVAVGGWLLLGDRLTIPEMVAIAVICSALSWLALATLPVKGLHWAVTTGMAIAVYTINDAAAVRQGGGALAYIATLTALSTLLLLPIALSRTGLGGLVRAVQAKPVALVTASALNIGAYTLVLIAATRAPVALVAAVRESSVVIGAMAGVVLLEEPFGRRRIIGAAAVAGGVIALGMV